MTSNPATPNLAFALKISLTTLALCLCLLVASPALGQQEASFQKRFTNQDIIDMAKLGLSRGRHYRQDSRRNRLEPGVGPLGY